MKVIEIPIENLLPDVNQPRKSANQIELSELVASFKLSGQLVPIIVLAENTQQLIIDGWRRYLAATECQWQTLKAIELDRRPSASELLGMQLAVNCARADLTVYERFEAYQRYMTLEKCTASELAKRLGISKGTVTRILSIGNLPADVQELVREGRIGSAGAYAMARMESKDQDLALAGIVDGRVDRKKLERLARKSPSDASGKVERVCCELPQGSVLIRSQKKLDLNGVVDVLEDLLVAVKKARKERLDIGTMTQVLRLRAQEATTTEAT